SSSRKVADRGDLPSSEKSIHKRVDIGQVCAAAAKRQIPLTGNDGAMLLHEVIVAPMTGYIVGILGVQVIVQVRGPGVMAVERKLAHSVVGVQLQSIVVRRTIFPDEGASDKLRIGTPIWRKWDQAGFRLIDVERVVEASASRTNVGATESVITNPLFKTHIELVDCTIVGFRRIT